MRVHELKIWPQFFDAVERGSETFELRKADRDYRVGDYIALREWDPGDPDKYNKYTGRRCVVGISHILSDENGRAFGLCDGFVILSIYGAPKTETDIALGTEDGYAMRRQIVIPKDSP